MGKKVKKKTPKNPRRATPAVIVKDSKGRRIDPLTRKVLPGRGFKPIPEPPPNKPKKKKKRKKQ